jgi:hypothetical protein
VESETISTRIWASPPRAWTSVGVFKRWWWIGRWVWLGGAGTKILRSELSISGGLTVAVSGQPAWLPLVGIQARQKTTLPSILGLSKRCSHPGLRLQLIRDLHPPASVCSTQPSFCLPQSTASARLTSSQSDSILSCALRPVAPTTPNTQSKLCMFHRLSSV